MQFHRPLICAVLIASACLLHAQTDEATRKLSRDIFQQLIDINTTDSVGNVTTAAEAMAKRLRDAGYPAADVQVLGPNDRKKDMVARLRGTGAKKPVLLIGHLDVVEARRSDWSKDPFQFVEEGGYFYGRGTQDMKGADAILVTTMIRLKQEGYKPDRDIILALTADEEGGKSNGVDWLLKNHRDLIDAEFVLNPDGGGVDTDHGKPVLMQMDATEKVYGDFQLEATSPGGHSSLPKPDNAIYHVADALVKLQQYAFPFELNEVTRAFFQQTAKTQTGQLREDMLAITKDPPDAAAIQRLSANPLFNSMMRTTCVATRTEAGHANNALPQRATANVNCRILPGHPKEQVRQDLIKLFGDPDLHVRYVSDDGTVTDRAPENGGAPPPPLRPDVMEPLSKVTSQMWPGIPVVPSMSTGASDGKYTNMGGMPTYGVSGIALDLDDVRAHGRDERVGVESFYRGVDFYYRYLKLVTGGTE